MPHVIVKMAAGRSEQDKKRLAERVALAVMNTLGTSQEAISVAIEDVLPDDWNAQVYDPDIAGRQDTIYKQPGYERF